VKLKHRDAARDTARQMVLKEIDDFPALHTLTRDVQVAPGIWVEVFINLKSDRTWEWK